MSATAALAWAHDQIGVTEKPKDSNWGHPVQDWIKASGYGGPVPYCQCGANMVASKGGAPLIKDGYTPNFLAGRYRAQGYVPVALSHAKPGDFVYFKWPGLSGAICDHVGILVAMTASTVTCIEFNTSSSNAGSQNNGGGVWLRTRSRGLVAGAVSVPYKGNNSKPFRSIQDGDEGEDVRALQIASNKRASGCGRPDRVSDVDGVCGVETLANVAWAAYILGIGDSQAELRSGGISPYVQTLVRDPDERNQAQLDRAPHRRQEAGCGGS